jgi:hypothetical protein
MVEQIIVDSIFYAVWKKSRKFFFFFTNEEDAPKVKPILPRLPLHNFGVFVHQLMRTSHICRFARCTYN